MCLVFWTELLGPFRGRLQSLDLYPKVISTNNISEGLVFIGTSTHLIGIWTRDGHVCIHVAKTSPPTEGTKRSIILKSSGGNVFGTEGPNSSPCINKTNPNKQMKHCQTMQL